MIEPTARPQGVMVPQGQLSPGQGPPRTVLNMAEAQTFGLEYVDDNGVRHITIAMRIGGRWHLPPNGESYAASLRPLGQDSWLAKQLEDRLLDVFAPEGTLGVAAPSPKGDVVDVIGRD